MELLASNWTCEVERGPGCLFIRLHAPADARDNPRLAEDIWEQLSKHLMYRLVLDMEDVPTLRSQLIGQLLSLREKITGHEGMLRLCGLSEQCQRTLRKTNLDEWLSFYPTREDAVMGRPAQPR
jgi:anti-anti-sigma factor